MEIKQKNIIHFVYSYPYEGALLDILGQKLTEEHSKEVFKKTAIVQKIWNKYEQNVLALFEEIYKTEISEKHIKAYVTKVASDSYSDPLTISIKYLPHVETDPKSQRSLVYTIIHELAHYFSYTRYPNNYFNNLYKIVTKNNIFGSEGVNLHYLIQAAEFGIIGEVFSLNYAEYSRDWAANGPTENEYRYSARLLKKDHVPLDKTCLKYIYENVLSKT